MTLLLSSFSAAAYERCIITGEFKLVDISDRLPTLKRRPGVTSWSVALDKESPFVSTYSSYLEARNSNKEGEKEKKKKDAQSKILPETIFAPQNAMELGLERAMRIYPHLQDTGGFFVAVLERVDVPAPAGGVVDAVKYVWHLLRSINSLTCARRSADLLAHLSRGQLVISQKSPPPSQRRKNLKPPRPPRNPLLLPLPHSPMKKLSMTSPLRLWIWIWTQ